MIRVMIMEDDLDFCYLIASSLKKEKDIELTGIFHSADEAVQNAKQLQPDIVLSDLSLSNNKLDGIAAARSIRIHTTARIIILSAFENEDTVLNASRNSFASCYLFKNQFDELIPSIQKVFAGHTPQEFMIKHAILAQLTSAESAVFHMMLGEDIQLLSSAKTISNQKTSVLHKLGLKNQKELQHIFRNY